jgi:hypothetical protein
MHVTVTPAGSAKPILRPGKETLSHLPSLIPLLQTLEGVARMGKSRPEQWSDGEIDKLRSLARTMPVKDLEKNFQRSRGAILAKAFSLRLSLDYRSEMRQNNHSSQDLE